MNPFSIEGIRVIWDMTMISKNCTNSGGLVAKVIH